MLRDIKKLLERNALTLAILATILIGILSLSAVPKLNIGLGIKSGDKYLHFIAYFGLSSIWYFALKDKIQKRLYNFFVPLALIFYGIILEGLQSGITTYRTGDIYDALANTVGVIVSLVVFKRIIKWYRTI
ncbi:VanZ family protein [Lutimonas sp.]|jgi:VanZ family protein|uniref:VanZ family protein n=1 Tax=Lutimonas sp. TaxID=1872403 RepID=UPI003C70FB68